MRKFSGALFCLISLVIIINGLSWALPAFVKMSSSVLPPGEAAPAAGKAVLGTVVAGFGLMLFLNGWRRLIHKPGLPKTVDDRVEK